MYQTQPSSVDPAPATQRRAAGCVGNAPHSSCRSISLKETCVGGYFALDCSNRIRRKKEEGNGSGQSRVPGKKGGRREGELWTVSGWKRDGGAERKMDVEERATCCVYRMRWETTNGYRSAWGCGSGTSGSPCRSGQRPVVEPGIQA